MTHSFLYGTAVFEGIRAYWNEEQGQLYLLKLREHYERIVDSVEDPADGPGLHRRRADGPHRRARPPQRLPRGRLRPGDRLQVVRGDRGPAPQRGVPAQHPARSRSATTSRPTGITCGTVSWRRTSDRRIPSRAKVVGSYVNPAFSKTEAMLNGYDEAIVLTHDGKVSEGSAENLFMVRKGQLVTPGVDNGHPRGHHPGRHHPAGRARSWASTTVVRGSIDRSELYVADEVFLCGTGAQVSPVDLGRPSPGRHGGIGPITQRHHDAPTSTPCAAGRRPTATG